MCHSGMQTAIHENSCWQEPNISLTNTIPDGHPPRNTGLRLFSSFIPRLRKPMSWPWNLPIFSIRSQIRIRQDSISQDGMTRSIIWTWGNLKLSRTLSAINTTLSLISLFIAQLMPVQNLSMPRSRPSDLNSVV